MTERFNKAFKASLIAHGSVLFLLLVVPLLSRLIKPEKPKEQITFIELVQPAPPATVPKVIAPAPEPEPEPVKEPVPKPVVKEVKKKEIKVNTNKIVRAKTPKAEPQKPKLSESELRNMLLSDLPVSKTAASSSGNPTEMSMYYGRIYKILDAAWVKPPGVAGLSTEISIRIAKNGAIIQQKLVGGSGSQAMDESVMSAVRSVATFPRLPDSISKPYIDVTIKFESTGLSM